LRFIPNIRYGTERYPERVARRLRAVNITVWFFAGQIYVVLFFFFIERSFHPTPVGGNEWKLILINLLAGPILLTVPLLHRFSPLAAPLFLILIAYAFIFALNVFIGTGTGTYLGFFTATALGILFIGPEYVWLTVTVSLVAVGSIIVLNMAVPHDTGIVSPAFFFGSFVGNVIASSAILYGIIFYAVRQFARAEEVLEERTYQLELANLAKSRFLAAASHDLRQPMHALGLFVAQLRSQMTSTERGRLVDRIDNAVTGMNELFNALLDITKLDAGALTATIAEFPIAELLGRIGSAFAPVAQEKGLSLVLVPSSAWVRSDPVLLERIVLNLVSNALRYTNAGGIVVGCRHRGAKLRIEVWDTGPGIPPEQHRKIFSEFYRLADAAKTNQAGLGLGRAIVDRLCTLLDHPIELTSTLGKGSRFAVTVPTAAARVTAQPKIEPSSQATLDVARGKLVVVIDNDPRVLEGMGGLLRNWGCRVIVAATPEVAMAGVSDIGAGARPDLIISDYHLADEQTGITAIAKLRVAYGAIPAFVMSGDTAPERLRKAQESGHHLLHKPVQPMMLRAMVSRFLKSGPA
jgi:signal transduction histidine kinase